ncbi:fimbrial protein [Salmonella enterica subsp. enterica]|nr:fimbrial protein [Salmonella enterica]EEH0655007.1 fimbrial protein [Salmonella enterica subsp. enterica serovar Windermere]HCB5025154.1 fimbrial protein [Salmonella enterica subsp. enterica serovar Bredeney]HCB5301653.1 fimbrial protein [Salmonella enterica subsp. enterica serovar Overschie]HCB5310668.1 fimbrial protein [Salmonella enterica subsp. enterica serovar Overschie]
MKVLLQSGWLVLALWLVAFGAQASCQFANGVTSETPGYISFGNIAVQRDAPVGSVIATATTGAYNNGNALAGCSETWTFRWELSKWGTLSSLGDKIYNTNIPGVGLKMTAVVSGRVIPYDVSVKPNTYVTIPGDGIKAELFKTGDITGGTLHTGMLARASVVNQFYFANVTLNGTNTITSESCSVTSNPVDVRLDKHDKSEFSGPGTGTAWQTFNIVLNCDKGARINVRIDATADSDAGVPGVIKLDSDPANASGVGVQVWYRYEDSPVQFGQERYYYTSPSGGDEYVQLQARYYQTTQSITAGKANATATFTLSYK